MTADPALLGTMAACTALTIMACPCEVDAAKCRRGRGRGEGNPWDMTLGTCESKQLRHSNCSTSTNSHAAIVNISYPKGCASLHNSQRKKHIVAYGRVLK